MQVNLTTDSATIDAHDLGPLLGLEPSEIPAKMRSGEITSRSENGIGEDEGRVRLTFWYQDQCIRLTCDAEGKVLKTTRIRSPR